MREGFDLERLGQGRIKNIRCEIYTIWGGGVGYREIRTGRVQIKGDGWGIREYSIVEGRR